MVLPETAPPGTFALSVATVFDDGSSPASENGTLGVQKDDVVSATYTDALDDNGATSPVNPVADLTVVGGDTGDLTLTAASAPFVPGVSIDIQLVDLDLAGTGSASVVLSNSTSGETETVILSETAPPGTFELSVATVFDDGSSPTSENGTLGVQKDDVVDASYSDIFNDVGGPEVVNATPLTVVGGFTGILTLTGPNPFLPGDFIDIELVDLDLAGAGKASVILQNSTSGEVETISLVETAPPGTFAESVATVFDDGSTPASENGTLGIQKDDSVTAEYTDALDVN